MAQAQTFHLPPSIARQMKLYELPVSEWRALQQLYARNWPQHVLSYYTLQNYIDWASKNPKMNDVRILTPDMHWREHGTYILEDRNPLRYNVLCGTLLPSNQLLMLSALRCLEREPAYTFTAYTDLVRPAIERHMRDLGIGNFEEGYYCPTLLYYLPRDECLKLEISELQDFVFKPLTEDYVYHIDMLWPHRYPGSDYKIRRIIRYNKTIGAYSRVTGELCAWVMQLQVGTIGMLQVEEDFKRRGLGEQLVRRLCHQLAQSGYDAIATVMDTNAASRALFEKLGFEIIDRVYWLDKVALTSEQDEQKKVVPASVSETLVTYENSKYRR